MRFKTRATSHVKYAATSEYSAISEYAILGPAGLRPIRFDTVLVPQPTRKYSEIPAGVQLEVHTWLQPVPRKDPREHFFHGHAADMRKNLLNK